MPSRPHFASVREDGRAVALDVLVEPDAGAGLGYDRCERGPCGLPADHAVEDKFLVMSRKGKRLGVAFAGAPREGGEDRRALANMALAFIRLARRSAERAGMDTKARSALQAASRMSARGRSTPKAAMLVPAQRRNWQGARSRRAPADP